MVNTTISFELPWPPTVNTYWRKNGRGMHISKRGLEYQHTVYYLCHSLRNTFVEGERLKVSISASPPDKKQRDLDNILKALFDSLEKACVFANDEQIDEIHIKRDYTLNGVLNITISVLDVLPIRTIKRPPKKGVINRKKIKESVRMICSGLKSNN